LAPNKYINPNNHQSIPHTTLTGTRFICVANIAFCALCPVDITTPDQ
jgi:hypothetical protein